MLNVAYKLVFDLYKFSNFLCFLFSVFSGKQARHGRLPGLSVRNNEWLQCIRNLCKWGLRNIPDYLGLLGGGGQTNPAHRYSTFRRR